MPNQSESVVRSLLRLSKDPQFGLRLGSRINLSSQGIFGFALMCSSTVGDALKLLVRYNRVILPSIRIVLKQQGHNAELIAYAEHLPTALQRFYCEVLFSAILNNGVILTNQSNRWIKVELNYQPEGNHHLYRKSLGKNLRFNCQRNALCFDEKTLAAKLSAANPLAEEVFRSECDRLFSPEQFSGSFSARVQQILIQSGSQFPTCKNMAALLHMSESTLQRRLAKEGKRYQQVLDQVRYRLASEYLLGTMLPVAEVSDLVGFNDVTNFRRSFKRWSQTTPSQFRANANLKNV